MTAPHETDRFRHAATYTVAVTFTVAGGARAGTAHRRAQRAAERIAGAAVRLSDVVEATATVGLALGDGQVVSPVAVRLPGANTGPALYGDPDKLARYLDPDHERALASLAEANARYRARRDADRARRRAVSCPNAHQLLGREPAYCPCVYCQPDRHLDTLTGLSSSLQFDIPLCLCGQPVHAPGLRCLRHRDLDVVVLDDDPDALTQIRQHLREAES